MMPCDDCGKLPTNYVKKYETIICKACEKKRDAPDIAGLANALLGWLEPELSELYPPGSFSGFFFFLPSFWISIIRAKKEKRGD